MILTKRGGIMIKNTISLQHVSISPLLISVMMSLKILLLSLPSSSLTGNNNSSHEDLLMSDGLIGSPSFRQTGPDAGFSLWIDEKQVKEYSGFPMRIHVIMDGNVLPYVTDPNFEKYLPIIPAEVSSVNFTWTSGSQKGYLYHFDQLISDDKEILANPKVSLDSKGKVPSIPRVFSLILPCLGNVSGVASFAFGLRIAAQDSGIPLKGTPLRLKLQKQCAYRIPDPECDVNCANGGWCNRDKICQCPKGYIGRYCHSALCYPICINGGTCIAPGVCSCPDGYQGPNCEGGICHNKCLNGGKCIQKDTCSCRRGYYGSHCEYSHCHESPCLNGGRCIGVNKCRCHRSFSGGQCEIRPAINNTRRNKKQKKRKKRKKFV